MRLLLKTAQLAPSRNVLVAVFPDFSTDSMLLDSRVGFSTSSAYAGHVHRMEGGDRDEQQHILTKELLEIAGGQLGNE